MADEDKGESVEETIATACRILGFMGLVRETTGHVSARLDDGRMLIRCRGKDEAGVIFTNAEAVRSVDFDGKNLDHAGQYETPTELPIHGEIYRARPDVNAVVHAHPRASLICTLLGLELKPIFGAFDPNAMSLAVAGIPIFPRSILIRDRALGEQLASTLGYKPVCILRGHGTVTTGASVQEATIRAIQLETLASMTLEIAKAGGSANAISAEDQEYFRKLRETQDAKAKAHGADVFQWTWRHYIKLMQAGEKRGQESGD
ncbi:MAG: class II aldolase/adducin family protein [Pseudomonadota bacterium]